MFIRRVDAAATENPETGDNVQLDNHRACKGWPARAAGLAAAALLPMAAHAQSNLSLYGMLDVGVQHLTHANAAGASQTALASGSFLPSRWGMRGQEDLGGGYNAFFLLEAGFNVDDGTNASPAIFFNRVSYVGLGTPYGAVSFGRQGSVQFDKTYLYDPMYFATYSNLSLNAAPISTLKQGNSIKFQSKSYGGFNLLATYGLGQELAGKPAAGRYAGVALEYTTDSLSARVLHEQQRGNVGATDQSPLTDRRSSVAASYKTGPFHFYGDYTRVSGDLKLSPPGHIYTVAAGWRASEQWRFVVEGGAYKQPGLSGATTLVNALAQYSLSPRTSLYAIAGRVNNKNGTQFGVAYPATMAVANQGQTGITLGVNHRF